MKKINMNRQTDRERETCMSRKLDKIIERQIKNILYRETGRQIDRLIDTWTDRQTPIDRQTNGWLPA